MQYNDARKAEEKKVSNHNLGFLVNAAMSVVIQVKGKEGRQHFNSAATLTQNILNYLCSLHPFAHRTTDT